MLENSVFIDGSQGRDLDKLFQSYNELGLQIQDLTTSRKNVAEQIKQVCDKPILYETCKYTIRMKSTPKQKEVITKELLKQKYPNIYNEVVTIEELPLGVQMGTPKKK